jgi:N-acetylated-alpha-linked acidic dipeptidase
MELYYDDLTKTIKTSNQTLDISALRSALDEFKTRTAEVKALETLALNSNDTDLLTVVNHKYRDFQRGFVSQGGLPTREFYRHVIFAPGIDTGECFHR